MRINVRVDTTRLFDRLRNPEKRLAYAVVNAINETAKAIQAAERVEVLGEFTIRKPDFILRQAAVIKPFANVAQGRPFAEVSIGRSARGAPLLLALFETGGMKPTRRATSAAPITGSAARLTFQSSVPGELRYTRLRLRKNRRGARVANRRTGLRGTYEVPGVGVFQRAIAGPAELIYGYGSPPKVERRLHWMDRAEAIANSVFPDAMERETIKALARG